MPLTRKAQLLKLLLGSLLLVNACTPTRNPESTVRIGEVGSMTGSEATFGTSTHNALLLAFDQANRAGGIRGKPIELVSLDDQSKSSEAVLAIENLISQKGVKAVVGEVASTITLAMAPIAQQHQIPMITPSSLNSKITQFGDFIFRTCFDDEDQAQAMASFAAKVLKVKRAALLYDYKSDYSTDSSTLFKKYFTQLGGVITAEQTYAGGDINFKAQLTALKGQSPDLLVVPGNYTEVGLIARQKLEIGISVPMLGGDAWDSPKLSEIGQSGIEGSYFITHFFEGDKREIVQSFIHDYKARYGKAPDGIAAMGYDAALVLIDALKRAEAPSPPSSPSSKDLPKAIQAALIQTKEIEGVTGKLSFDAGRNARTPAVVLKIEKGGKLLKQTY